MNKGFNLIEIIMYISLLSLMLIGIFSTLLSLMQSREASIPFSDENYSLLISNFHE